MTSERVEVTQADRDAARWFTHHGGNEEALLQAFARHRLSHQPNPVTERNSTPEEQARAIAAGHALDAEDGGYPVTDEQQVEALRRLVRDWETYRASEEDEWSDGYEDALEACAHIARIALATLTGDGA